MNIIGLIIIIILSASVLLLLFNTSQSDKVVQIEGEEELARFLFDKLSLNYLSKEDEFVTEAYNKVVSKNAMAIAATSFEIAQGIIFKHGRHLPQEILDASVQTYLEMMCPVIALCMHTGMTFEEATKHFLDQVNAS